MVKIVCVQEQNTSLKVQLETPQVSNYYRLGAPNIENDAKLTSSGSARHVSCISFSALWVEDTDPFLAMCIEKETKTPGDGFIVQFRHVYFR